MTVVRAFDTSNMCARWIDVWKGDKLSDLSRDVWKYFKEFYGIENLAITHIFDDGFGYDDDCYFYDEEF